MEQKTPVWAYGDDVDRTEGEIIGYDVIATDGKVGSVEEETLETDRSQLVVDTGFWLFGTKRLVPAGAVIAIDHAEQTVRVQMTKEQLENSPKYEPDQLYDQGTDPHMAYYTGIAWARF